MYKFLPESGSPEFGGNGWTLPNSSDGCWIPFYAVDDFFVRVKCRKNILRKIIFFFSEK